MTTPNNSDPTLRVLVAVVAGLVVLAVAVVWLQPGQAEVDPDSPEGVVQTYLRVWLEGAHDDAPNLLVDGDDCDAGFVDVGDRSLRVVLESTEVEGDRAEVTVAVTESSGDPLGGSEYTSSHTFVLERTEEGWLIDRLPPRFDICPERP